MSEFTKRALVGLVFVIVMVSCIWFSKFTAAALFGFIVLMGLWEFLNLQRKDISKFKIYSSFIIATLLFSITLPEIGVEDYLVYLAMLFFCAVVMISIFIKEERRTVSDWSHIIFAQVYVTLPFILLLLLAEDKNRYNYEIILSFFIILWLSDTGAYLVGKNFGKHKMIPNVSPKKTWEGLAGGVLCAMLGSYLLMKFGWKTVDLPWYVLGALISVLGAIGDLFESQLKRSSGVKDSGKLMPGHGGILDRFDGVLFSVTVIFALVKLMS